MKPMFILVLAFALVVASVQGDDNTNEESLVEKGFDFLTNIYMFNSILIELIIKN